MTEQLTHTPELGYTDQRIEIEGFARMDGEKTVAYFPDPPTIIERITETGVIRETLLTDEHEQTVEEAMGRKKNRTYLSADLYEGKIVIRFGVQYDLLDPLTGETIRHRDIREGQEARRMANLGLNLKNGSGIHRSDPTSPEESL